MRRLQDELTNAVRTDIACIEREVSRLIEQAEGDISVLQRHAGMRPLVRVVPELCAQEPTFAHRAHACRALWLLPQPTLMARGWCKGTYARITPR